jgi:PII-like signaling protein
MQVTMVKIYLTEAEEQLEPIFSYLHDEAKVSGVTVLRGITGFGKSGEIHSSKLIDLSFSLPLIIEFFDRPERIAAILEWLKTIIEPGHIISWQAELHGTANH